MIAYSATPQLYQLQILTSQTSHQTHQTTNNSTQYTATATTTTTQPPFSQKLPNLKKHITQITNGGGSCSSGSSSKIAKAKILTTMYSKIHSIFRKSYHGQNRNTCAYECLIHIPTHICTYIHICIILELYDNILTWARHFSVASRPLAAEAAVSPPTDKQCLNRPLRGTLAVATGGYWN